jgi:putative transposase
MVELAPEQVYPSDLTDAQWARLEPLLAKARGPGHPQEYSLRAIVNAILYLLRSGCQWRMIPRDFPKWNAVRYHFDAWQRDGTWARVLAALRGPARRAAGREPTPTAGVIDSQSVKASEAADEVGWDGGKKDPWPQAPPRRRHAGEPAGGGGDARRCA